MKHLETYHFYASSCATWVTTTPDRDLAQLIEMMVQEGYPFNLFMVPGAHDSEYQIKMYCPQVEGAEWLGTFNFNEENEE